MRPSSFPPLVLVAATGRVDRPPDVSGTFGTADRYIRSGTILPNGVDVYLKLEKDQHF